jgi:hypothetical protein
MRIGGRLAISDLHVDAKHQIILRRSHHVTRTLIQKCHVQNEHISPLHILAMLWQKYCNNTLSANCLVCYWSVHNVQQQSQ